MAQKSRMHVQIFERLHRCISLFSLHLAPPYSTCQDFLAPSLSTPSRGGCMILPNHHTISQRQLAWPSMPSHTSPRTQKPPSLSPSKPEWDMSGVSFWRVKIDMQ